MSQSFGQWLEKSYRIVRDRSGSSAFKIDHERNADVAHRFCQMRVRIVGLNSDRFILELHNLPRDEDLDDLVDDLQGTWSENARGTSDLKLNFDSRDYGTINRLALAIRRVVGRGKKYDDKNWKWVTRRTADSLTEFARVLRAYRSSL